MLHGELGVIISGREPCCTVEATASTRPRHDWRGGWWGGGRRRGLSGGLRRRVGGGGGGRGGVCVRVSDVYVSSGKAGQVCGRVWATGHWRGTWR